MINTYIMIIAFILIFLLCNKNIELFTSVKPKDMMVGCGRLDKWFPYNYKLPTYYQIPYKNRFHHSDHIWNSPYEHTYYDLDNSTFLY